MNSYSISTSRSSSAGQSDARNAARKLPVLLFDVMDTIVRDPFYEDIPAFFGYHSTLPFGIRHFDIMHLFVQRSERAKNLSRNLVALFYVFAYKSDWDVEYLANSAALSKHNKRDSNGASPG
ncbi:hypothetical protein Nepgr_027770 [Nepenthes gracilis]|uniref:Uncharacterized protein n=1 Tax=Nepenthes gracilis TaxID=150966 RepID=A0AAD3TAN8_NEPGR|nr:hypothetical protein Nepgr_027770 [Nepenthes gracilis]